MTLHTVRLKNFQDDGFQKPRKFLTNLESFSSQKLQSRFPLKFLTNIKTGFLGVESLLVLIVKNRIET